MSETQQPYPYGSPCTHLCTTAGERHRHVTWVQFPKPPAIEPTTGKPTADELLEMLKELRGELQAVNIWCSDPAWKGRRLHAPNCWCLRITEIDATLRAAEAES